MASLLLLQSFAQFVRALHLRPRDGVGDPRFDGGTGQGHRGLTSGFGDFE